MEIKIAEEKDRKQIIELMQKIDYSLEEAITKTKTIISNKKIFLIAKDLEKIIGYIAIKRFDDEEDKINLKNPEEYAHINWIGVDYSFRHQKVGSNLLKESEKIIKEWDKKKVWLECKETKLPFYFSNGYKVIGENTRNNIQRLVLSKEI